MASKKKRTSMKLEREFQLKFVKELKEIFEGCIIIRTDPRRTQGIPDLIMLWKDKWAAFELKRCKNARKRPNQSYYVDRMNEMSYAAFIFPENKEEVLDDLQRTFKA